MRNRILAATVVIAAAMAMLGTGQAAAADNPTCLTTGTADFSPPMQLLGGAGNVTLYGTGYCIVNGVPVMGTVSGSGTYASVICGTFTMDGTWNWPGFGTRSFHYQFVAWQGRDGNGGSMHMVPSGAAPPTTCATGATYVATIGP